MNDNTLRNGNFTSSEIIALTKLNKKGDDFGEPAKTYIRKKNFERKAKRSLNVDSPSKETKWGNLLEPHVFDLLPLDYNYQSKVTYTHPKYEFWKGSPDGIKFDEGKTVYDIKCPFTLNSFCGLVEPLTENKNWVETYHYCSNIHDQFLKYYWQLVSNACIVDAKYAELIVYCPYLDDIEIIKNLADGNADYYFVSFAKDYELPYLLKEGVYKDLNIIRFEVPNEHKDYLTNLVEKAGNLLINV